MTAAEQPAGRPVSLLVRESPARLAGPGQAPVAFFCGGSGSSAFAARLASQLAPVRFIVNAYDDGLSTGRIRRHLGIVGPSDLAKLVATLAGHVPGAPEALRRRLESDDAAGAQAEIGGLLASLPLPPDVREYLNRAAEVFAASVAQHEARQGPYDWADTAVRNVFVTGAAVLEGSMQRGLDRLNELLALPAEIILAHDAPDTLIGVDADGRVVPSERGVSYAGPDGRAPLVRVHIVPAPLSPALARRLERPGDPDGTSARIRAELGAGGPASARARSEVRAARAVVYAPGTLFSSIVPTAMLLRDDLAASPAPKVMVANLVQEDEQLTVAAAVLALWRCAEGQPFTALPGPGQVAGLVTQVLVDRRRPAELTTAAGRGTPVPVDPALLATLAPSSAHPFEDPARPGRHLAQPVVAALEHALARR